MINTQLSSNNAAANLSKSDLGLQKSDEKPLSTQPSSKEALSAALKKNLGLSESTAQSVTGAASKDEALNLKLKSLINKVLNDLNASSAKQTPLLKENATNLNFAPNFSNELKFLASELEKNDIFKEVLQKLESILKPASEAKTSNLSALFKNSGVFLEAKLKDALNPQNLPQSFHSLVNAIKSLSSDKIATQIINLADKNLDPKASLNELKQILTNAKAQNQQTLQNSAFKALLWLGSKLENFEKYLSKNPNVAQNKITQIAKNFLQSLEKIEPKFKQELTRPQNLILKDLNLKDLNSAFEKLKSDLKALINGEKITPSAQSTAKPNVNAPQFHNTQNHQNAQNGSIKTETAAQNAKNPALNSTLNSQNSAQNAAQGSGALNSKPTLNPAPNASQTNSQNAQNPATNSSTKPETAAQSANQSAQSALNSNTAPNLNVPNSQNNAPNSATPHLNSNQSAPESSAQTEGENLNLNENMENLNETESPSNKQNTQQASTDKANAKTQAQNANLNANLNAAKNTPNQTPSQAPNAANAAQANAQANSQALNLNPSAQESAPNQPNNAQNAAQNNATQTQNTQTQNAVKNLIFTDGLKNLSELETLSKDIAALNRQLSRNLKELDAGASAAKTNLADIKNIENKAAAALKDIAQIANKSEEQISTSIKNDIKSTLLQTATLAKSIGDEGTASMANRLLTQIELNQLVSLANDSFNTYVPYFWEDLQDSKLVFKRGKKDKFFAQIKLDFKSLGQLDVLIALNNEKYIDINIMAENKDFRRRIYENAHELKRAINKAGLLSSNFFVGDIVRSKFDDFNHVKGRDYEFEMGIDKEA